MVNPEGILIGPSNRQWRVGKRLGSGACGYVHELVKAHRGKTDSDLEYVVKLAPLPPPSKSKKRKKTAVERNADLLFYEFTLYRNLFNNLRGNMVPDLPIVGSKLPTFEDIDGK